MLIANRHFESEAMDSTLSKAISEGICEIRWHGRGGQGAVSSAKILAVAAYRDGCRGVTSAPSFGAERRGAPVTASTRLSAEPIRLFSQSESPDMVIVLDDSLIATADATAGLKPGGWIVVNSRRAPADLALGADFQVATADANEAAEEAGLIVSGQAMVNTAMLGAVARATGIISLDEIEKAFAGTFSPKAAKINYDAARLTYERTRL
jgi:pyruvate ferredoxin oxidoreductase gamma subunit